MKLPKGQKLWVSYRDGGGKYKWLVTSDELRTTYILWKVLPNGELSKIKQSKSPAGFKAIIDADSREKHGL